MTYRNPLIDFLRAYGPSEAANNLFDEHVVNAAERYRVAPFSVDNPLLSDLQRNFDADKPQSVVLTGTAGDGKTYLCRKLFERLGGSAADFREAGEVARIRLSSGQTLTIIKDLSELREADKERELEAVTRAFVGDDPDHVHLIAANDGQLLKFWRDFVDVHTHAQRVFEALRWMLKEERSHHTDLPGLRLENLSRQSNAELFEQVVDAVLRHTDWGMCDGCPVAQQQPACPILENRRRLGADESSMFRQRLKDSIALAAANDLHLPMRQLFLLVSNILLGDSDSLGLLSCQKAQNRAQARRYAATNPYDNALGFNLRPSYRERYAAFTTLSSLGIGQETNSDVDALLIEAAPPELHAAHLANDPLYGANLLEDARSAYLRGERERFEALLSGLEAQRRRLYFTLPDEGSERGLAPWALTVFQSGGEYLRLQAKMRDEKFEPPLLRRLVKGLNRTFTGTMTDDTELLWLAIPPGNVHDRTGRVLEHPPIPILRGRMGAPFITVDSAGVNSRLRLILTHRGAPEPFASIELRPLMFEYLIRVANGSLPASFSRQCFEELKHFRLQATAALTELDDVEPSDGDMQLVSLDPHTGRLNGSLLAIRETY
ncbi:hypothetical protein [Thioalkalivibrio sp. ALE12]|uniref:hypothetical protein n=1 Tax=Thioalkalivibrio sp. ALE12 TaxID=1158170 RepID=UPI00035F3A16|nr:hypothetical protein [Thioalkalivibrio sp. ALE12]